MVDTIIDIARLVMMHYSLLKETFKTPKQIICVICSVGDVGQDLLWLGDGWWVVVWAMDIVVRLVITRSSSSLRRCLKRPSERNHELSPVSLRGR